MKRFSHSFFSIAILILNTVSCAIHPRRQVLNLNLRIRSFLILISVAASILGKGQPAFFNYHSIKKDKYFSFPIFSGSMNLFAIRKINRLLQLSELEQLAGNGERNIFKQVANADAGLYGSKTAISFTVLQNTKKVLSISFDDASCGITCAYWQAYYNFNSGNGDRIQLSDLFTEAGFKSFKNIVKQARSENFKKEISNLNSTAKEELSYVLDGIDNDELEDFYFEGDKILIDGNNLLSKSDKFFGLNMRTSVRLSEFKSFLNHYGRTAFGLQSGNISAYSSHSLPQLYEGLIGDSLQILFLLRHDARDKMLGGYAELKSGRLITLAGTLNKSNLFLSANDTKADSTTITAQYLGNAIDGTWTIKSKSISEHFHVVKKR